MAMPFLKPLLDFFLGFGTLAHPTTVAITTSVVATVAVLAGTGSLPVSCISRSLSSAPYGLGVLIPPPAHTTFNAAIHDNSADTSLYGLCVKSDMSARRDYLGDIELEARREQDRKDEEMITMVMNKLCSKDFKVASSTEKRVRRFVKGALQLELGMLALLSEEHEQYRQALTALHLHQDDLRSLFTQYLTEGRIVSWIERSKQVCICFTIVIIFTIWRCWALRRLEKKEEEQYRQQIADMKAKLPYIQPSGLRTIQTGNEVTILRTELEYMLKKIEMLEKAGAAPTKERTFTTTKPNGIEEIDDQRRQEVIKAIDDLIERIQMNDQAEAASDDDRTTTDAVAEKAETIEQDSCERGNRARNFPSI
jgi:hypothetical protein